MKIAVILCGHVRTWELCKESFFEMFPPERFDIFMETYTKQYEYHPYIQGQLNYFSDNTIINVSSSDISKGCEIRDTSEEKKLDDRMKDFTHGFSQYSKFQKGIEQMLKYERENSIKYDYLIKTRFDLIYTPEAKTINFDRIKGLISNGERFLILDNNNTFPNDHIIMGCRDDMINLPKFILSEYINPTDSLSWTNPPHGLLENYIRTKGLDVQLLNLTTVVRR